MAVCLDVHTRHYRYSASGDDDLRTAARGVQQAGQKVSEGEGVADRIQGAGGFRHCSVLYAPGGAAEAKEVQLLYPLKRFLYTYGVYGDESGIYEALLPEQLPDACTGYRFRTQGSLIAQDYHASSYLTFYTDAATLDTYAAYYDSMDCERIQYDPVGETDEEQFPHLSWFCGQMQLDQTMPEHSEQMTLYWFDSYYPKGVLLDYDTGLVAVLT